MLRDPAIREAEALSLYEAPSSTETYIAIPASMIEDYKVLIETSNLSEEGKQARLDKLKNDGVCYPPDEAKDD